ncbi:hypothetical protein [Xanthomonas campestris]|uniref:hypothetical protein n=1 Tax=Xanthomonas campestris TaxID=339 RepID=UPI001374AFFE|nr:hypothetical protein [Xanthomonas campestris]
MSNAIGGMGAADHCAAPRTEQRNALMPSPAGNAARHASHPCAAVQMRLRTMWQRPDALQLALFSAFNRAL